MIDESNTCTVPRWLRTASCVAVMCALPLGFGSCDQPDTAAAPGDEAMEATEPAPSDAAQAGDRASSDQPSEGDGTERINQLRRELRAQVAAGEITEEQMRQRVSRAQQRLEAARGGSGNR